MRTTDRWVTCCGAGGMPAVVRSLAFSPMLASSGPVDLRRGAWVVEPKLDGWRTTVAIDPGTPRPVTVRTRTGRIVTDRVPELEPPSTSPRCVSG